MFHIILFSPLLGFFLAFIAGLIFTKKTANKLAIISTCGLMSVSTFLSVYAFYHQMKHPALKIVKLWEWLSFEGLSIELSLQIDSLSIIMLCVVTIVSLCVHIYSIGYMDHDPHLAKFMSYLSLFTFMMLLLVTSANLIQLFMGWEGVGLCSYLLIGFWNEKPKANNAALKAFVVNRVGDLGFVLGVCVCVAFLGKIDFQFLSTLPAIKESFPLFNFYGLTQFDLIVLFFLWGAMGKSAQFGLHTWLPDAMEGPTPVSALIHAATMVTAGIFLLVRLSPMVSIAEVAQPIILAVGTVTAFFAGTVGLVQQDIKRVVAYSTCSQLGYMMMAVGLSAYHFAIFHLFTHAFFKALLFLGAGSVIHALSGEQNLSKMGGIYKAIPKTYAFMWIGTLALIGFPFMAGFYSKELIIGASFVKMFSAQEGGYFYLFTALMAVIVVFLTSFYSLRLMFKAFHGKANADERVMAHIHDSHFIMLFPLFILSIGAVLSGIVFMKLFTTDQFWIGVLPSTEALAHQVHHLPSFINMAILSIMFFGVGVSYLFFVQRNKLLISISSRFPKLYQFLSMKWYFDELYDKIIVKPSFSVGNNFWQKMDLGLIDRFGPDGFTGAVLNLGRRLVKAQSGYLYHYVFVMVVGVIIFIMWFRITEGLY